MTDLLPQWLQDFLGNDILFWLGYLTNGKHLAWYAEAQGLDLDRDTKRALLEGVEPKSVLTVIREVFRGDWRAAA